MFSKNAGILYITNSEEISKLRKILDELEARTREAMELARELEELVRSTDVVTGDATKASEESFGQPVHSRMSHLPN
ncbi:hypothetical protein ACFLYG_03100 [Chloroflexota bacterium]